MVLRCSSHDNYAVADLPSAIINVIIFPIYGKETQI